MAIQADPTVDPWLSGNFAPVADELVVDDLAIEGELPEALQGAFLRNGGNPAFAPIGRYHLFDGDGMVHAVELSDGKARYRNRFVESKGLVVERRAGRALYGGLSQFVLPADEVLAEAGMIKNTANTNVIRHAGRILALMEACLPTELSPELATLGEYDFGGRLSGSMTAHPKMDPKTGEMVFFGAFPMPPFLRYHVVDATGVLTRSVEIDIPRPVMMHDFVITERHAVFFDLPAVYDIEALMTGGGIIRWDPDAGARIGVLPRDGASPDVRWFDVDPFYVFHFMNAWEDEAGRIVVDGCRADRLPLAFGDEVIEDSIVPTLHRWTIDLTNGTVGDEQLDDRPGDFPRVAEAASGSRNSFGYMTASSEWASDTVLFDGFIKHDLRVGTSQHHSYGLGIGGEPVFAADPEGSAEDDGWILNFVYDRADNSSDLVIVDARHVDAEPVARVKMPRRVPFGFHGNWMPTA